MMRLKMFGTVVLFFVSSMAYAVCVQNNNVVTFVGLDSPDGTVYVDIKSHDNGCGCDKARFNPQNTKAEMALSILLTAKMSDNKVRIDFLEENSCSTAYRVYLQ